ncbi:polymeric immunoglobulin receptor-like isoform X1 [Gambusia affinis]|uniref:polymeric immunoglobulin receptor-like isoform X1 n=1 Tax=Gambusia affinis TaxID=33528 RepID=UPI001CDBB040|nr:polymeric immunoglobulin receptor-like isoform X1 [Gambusia affinis]
MWSRQLIIICTALSFVISAEGLIEVFGYEGRDVKITCSYDEGYQNNNKYLCKNECGSSDVLITTKQKNKGKYSITDNIKIGVVTVTISDLQSRDAGKYWCGITVWGPDIYTEVKLHIKEDRCCNNVNKIQSIEEGSVTISCPYDSQSVNKLKFLCRGNRPSTCLQQAVITSSNTQNGRFRLSDDRKSTIFTVTISSLTLEDSGSYLCGVQRNSGFDDFSAVELEVKAKLFYLKSSNISGIEGRPVTLQCPNSGQQHDNKKFLCKGDQHNNCTDMMENQTKFKLLNVSSICFSVIITELEAADAGTYYCGSASQLTFIKIQLAVDSLHQTSSVAPISSAEQVTSQPPSHNPDLTLFYILRVVLFLLWILPFVLLMIPKRKSKQQDIQMNVLNTSDTSENPRINDICEPSHQSIRSNNEAAESQHVNQSLTTNEDL